MANINPRIGRPGAPECLQCTTVDRGAPKGRTQGPGPSPWDLPSTRFSGFILLNYIICIFAACVRNIFAMWEDRASLQYGIGLTLR